MFVCAARGTSCKAFLPVGASENALCMLLGQAVKATLSSSGFAQEDGEC